MQLAAAGHEERIGVAGFLDAQRHVGQQLAHQAVADVARRHVLALAAGERRRVDLEIHRQRRLVHRDRRQRLGQVDRGQRRADRQVVDAGDEHDIAGAGALHGHAVQALEHEQLADASASWRLAVGKRRIDDGHLLPGNEHAAPDTTDAQPADVARIVERAHLKLQRSVDVSAGRRNLREDRLEQRPHVAAPLDGLRACDIERRPAIQRGRVDDRKVELVVAGPQAIEQLERLVHDPLGARARAVDLVDDDDRSQALRQCLLGDESRLRHRPLDGIDQQQDAIDHPQHAFDLAAEVGVPRRIDDVDVHDAVFVRIADGAVLREDRDAALALDVVAVHHPLADVLVLGERPRLHEQLVDERRLAVVDVRDDRDVA